ncbi:MAG: glycosyltransferase family 2 protein [Oscillospiraceae bacterium]
MDKYQLSIIIPHYNTPDLLDTMLTSIPQREDVQVIVVDDNSTRELQELQNVLNKHSSKNLEFYISPHTEHSTGLCRNVGLDHALGKWILFGDADDYYTNGWLDIVQEFFDSDYDLVFFQPTSIVLSTGEAGTRHQMYEDKIRTYCNDPTPQNELLLRYDTASVCLKLHRRSLIEKHNIRFEQGLAEDTLFSAECGKCCEKLACINKALYCITERSGSKTAAISKSLYDQRVKVKIRKCGMLYKILDDESIVFLQLENVGLQVLYSAFADKMGIRKIVEYARLLRAEGVPIINRKHANPFTLFRRFLKSVIGRLRRR